MANTVEQSITPNKSLLLNNSHVQPVLPYYKYVIVIHYFCTFTLLQTGKHIILEIVPTHWPNIYL